MTSSSTLPNIKRISCSLATSTTTEITTDSNTDAVRSWEAAAPACSLSFFPIYWLMTTAPPDASAVNMARGKEAAADFHEAENVAAAKALAAKIEGKTVTIKAKGGASGRLHGKVTGKEVAEALAALAGAPIDKKKIELETKDIKDAGVFNGKVRLYVGVVASFKIQVEVEQA